jgi:anti-anti-sigma factor
VSPKDSETKGPAEPGQQLGMEFRLRLSGELAAGAGVGNLEKALRAALQASPSEIVVDLTDVELVDEAGLTALLKVHLRSRQRGLPIRFEPSDHEAVRQLVAVTGTD